MILSRLFAYNTRMELSADHCRQELQNRGLIPRKYHGQVFTTDPDLIDTLVKTTAGLWKPGTRIVEIGGGLGYITEALIEAFDQVDCVELDEEMFDVLLNKFSDPKFYEQHPKLNKFFIQIVKIASEKQKREPVYKKIIHIYLSEHKKGAKPKKPKNKNSEHTKEIRLIHADILKYMPPKSPYLLVGNIPFHVSGRLYRRFMSELSNKPTGMVFITDKQYAKTLMGQPPRCYRVSLQAQAYGKIRIIADVPPQSVYPSPKVMSCIMEIAYKPVRLPKNFWQVVNYHFDHFPTPKVQSPKTVGLQGWIELAKTADPPA
jgi:16S rRNA A1518/A1519 N6-dimethyltransferase RsmA/KsgA/DIM1 with predicted DNA glycosylase/AP lyase activity